MFFEQNEEKTNSPKKTFNIFNMFNKEKDNKDNKVLNSPYKNDDYSSPLTKTNVISYSNNSIYQKYNKINIYSPYVKRICISDNKKEDNQTETIKEIVSNKFYNTSFKKIMRKKSEKISDRFIPLNKGINLLDKFNLISKFNEVDENNYTSIIKNNEKKTNKDLYDKILKSIFLKEYNCISSNNKNNKKDNFKFFTYKKEKQKIIKNYFYELKNIEEETKGLINNNTSSRKISKKPYKELYVPNLMDDFYLNLLDWSSKNIIAVACSSSVILWNLNNSLSNQLFKYKPINLNNNQNNENIYNIYASSLIFSENGEQLAVGNSCGYVELYDINKNSKICSFKGHSARVGVVSWNKNILSSGSKDYSIITRDIRCKNDDENIIKKFYGHNQEVCGLKWSFDGNLLASGGNDNKLMIWSLHSNKPLMCNNEHLAAVKAIAWSPHRHNILASGGGTADKTIRFWNTNNFEQISKIDTGSQVCNLVFSKTSNELASTHGYSLNQIITWKLPNMEKQITLTGHSYRVLYLSLSPDGQSIVTAAGDKMLKFWNVFPPFKNDYDSKLFPSNNDCR